jgi:hypothetical protein
MVRKGRYRDRHKVGSSRIAGYQSGEPDKKRHQRRLAVNLAARDTLATWCHNRRIAMLVNNEGHHWIFRRAAAQVEWWPSSAKLVVNQDWRNGWHCHDWQQVQARLAIMFPPLEEMESREQ